MLPISSVTGNLAAKSFLAAHRDESKTVDKQTAQQGIRVSLSDQAKKASAAAKKNDDIDKSSLPDNIKKTLKLIRQLREQIAEKQKELEAVMADKSLSEKARAQKAQGIQGEIATLNGAIIAANGALLQAVKQAGLSPDQLTEMSGLMMA